MRSCAAAFPESPRHAGLPSMTISASSAANLYVHFPFCRGRCSYCALFSRGARPAAERDAYARRIADSIRKLGFDRPLDTVYLGGGSPALCDLRPVLSALSELVVVGERPSSGTEFTVELHPLDVTPSLLATLKSGGVNRISMGVQSLDDAILAHMRRGYVFSEAERAFAAVKDVFDNAGIDLIVGYPGETAAILPRHERLKSWGLRHCSVYALQNERGLSDVIDDETAMNRLRETAAFLSGLGLRRYEISNYAASGFECRHNLAVWRGEDYIGLGDGACGRVGRLRTRNFWGWAPGQSGEGALPQVKEMVSAEFDEKERRFFRLRTREGLDAGGHPEWGRTLSGFVSDGLLTREGEVYRLTERGAEVCDAILADLA